MDMDYLLDSVKKGNGCFIANRFKIEQKTMKQQLTMQHLIETSRSPNDFSSSLERTPNQMKTEHKPMGELVFEFFFFCLFIFSSHYYYRTKYIKSVYRLFTWPRTSFGPAKERSKRNFTLGFQVQ